MPTLLDPLKVPPQGSPYTTDQPSQTSPDGTGIKVRVGLMGANSGGRIFNILWWKFFQSVVDWINDLQEQIAAIVPNTSASYVTDGISTTDGGGVLSGGTSSLVSPTATPNEGDLWTAYLTQPGAGNELVDLTGIVPSVNGLSLSGTGSINNVSRGSNKVTALSFICRADGDWWVRSATVLA